MNVKKAELFNHRPANHNESISSMAYKVHDAYLMLLVFLDLKKYGSFTDKILSN